MGNYQSCISCPNPCKPSRSVAKLLDPQGNLSYLQLPIGAAEIMLDFPGYVVASLEELHRTGQIVGLRADDDLVVGNMYLMVSRSKINCKVTAADMAAVESAAGKGKRSGGDQGKVGAFWEEQNSINSKGGGGGQRKCSSRRQWNPALETILEQ